MTQDTPVTTVPHVDLNRYLGTWFELKRLPMKWEDTYAADITATYSLEEGGKVRVDNRCLNDEGKPTQSIGQAEPVDASNSKLTVTFLPELLRWIPFTSGDYWILKLDPDYKVALIGDPDRRYLWLLAREPQLPQAVIDEYLDHARTMGYDLSPLITPRQSGAQVSDAMLAQA
ncbi:lipocalin family protein [Xinfangfangia sp. CPCC 101601]|uniref:Outer membrane lipoprotein Blc n=1 Tax=Pseudogemmobacter lacusdianii TaxID=3069608 RepID=A0ABU0W075_9RHOB|nr:lipocalin family protein [Xinfangfangia sp. CPCC 101601]MDQ2067398.1 lipocalin family protein [Xinfangfangia sp. CPCC 101601]